MKISQAWKAVVALIGAAAGAAALYIGDGQLTAQEGAAIVLAVLTAGGVYRVENSDGPREVDDPRDV